MFGSAVIVFRETLEAALIISIVAVATLGLPNRKRWIVAGIVAGVAGSLGVAGMTETIAELGDGLGQEMFNAVVLGLAVLMLAWHSIWMARHGMELSRDARQLGNDVKSGRREMSALAVVISLAVLREGSETVLFIYSLLVGGNESLLSIGAGGALGLAAGLLAGWGLYAGFVRIPIRWLFSVTNALVLVLAAALSSNMARFLVAADLIPPLADPLWDSTAILDQSSVLGQFLKLLVGYEDQPLGIQVVFYFMTMIVILFGMRLSRPAPVQQVAMDS